MSATVTLTAEIVQRSHDATQHNVEKDENDVYTLSTTIANYTTDTPAFATTVYTAYAADVAVDDNVEIRYFVNVQQVAEDSGEINAVLSSHTDLETQFNKVIANAVGRTQLT